MGRSVGGGSAGGARSGGRRARCALAGRRGVPKRRSGVGESDKRKIHLPAWESPARPRSRAAAPPHGTAPALVHPRRTQRPSSNPSFFPQDPMKRHELERTAVKEVVCALCEVRQPAAPACNSCGVAFGVYICMRCCFFEDDVRKKQAGGVGMGVGRLGGGWWWCVCLTAWRVARHTLRPSAVMPPPPSTSHALTPQFHCDRCGICRVGGADNFFHCDTCGCCYSKSLEASTGGGRGL